MVNYVGRAGTDAGARSWNVMKSRLTGITIAVLAGTAEAGEVVAALGGSDISFDAERASGIAELSYRFDDADNVTSPDVAIAAFDAGYVFAGVGVTARSHFDASWFAEAGVQMGVLASEAKANPAFRASVAIGRSFHRGTLASLGLAQVVSEGETLTSAALRVHIDI